MNHRAAPSFWEAYGSLPPATRDLADRSFELLKQHPSHYSLRLKKGGFGRSVSACIIGRSRSGLRMDFSGSGSATIVRMSGSLAEPQITGHARLTSTDKLP